jgi:hypothetical protein
VSAIIQALETNERKAWDALSRYKFWMFGYHAGQWVALNRLLPTPKPNPFRRAVLLGKEMRGPSTPRGAAA